MGETFAGYYKLPGARGWGGCALRLLPPHPLPQTRQAGGVAPGQARDPASALSCCKHSPRPQAAARPPRPGRTPAVGVYKGKTPQSAG